MRSVVWQLCTVLLICAKTTITDNLLKLLPDGWVVLGSRGVGCRCAERMGGVCIHCCLDACNSGSWQSHFIQPLLGCVPCLPSCPHDWSPCVCRLSICKQSRSVEPNVSEEASQAAAGLLGRWQRCCCLSYVPCCQWPYGMSPSLVRFTSVVLPVTSHWVSAYRCRICCVFCVRCVRCTHCASSALDRAGSGLVVPVTRESLFWVRQRAFEPRC